MRYDAENDILHIDVREAVAYARRGISGYTVSDEDEPLFGRSDSPHGFAPEERKALALPYDIGGYRLLLTAHYLRAEGNEIYILCPVESMGARRGREAKKQFRGEAFLAAAILAHYEKERTGADIPHALYKLHSVFYASDTREVLTEPEEVSFSQLNSFADKCLSALPEAIRAEIERVCTRIPSMKNVRFPYGKPREGQDEFIRTAYKTMARGGSLYAMAPTGTGKTVSALFPAIRALGNGKCDKVFYLTPKTTTAEAARDCISALCSTGAVIRSITLIAKDRLCPRRSVCREAKHLCPTMKQNRIGEAVMALFDAKITNVTPSDVSRFAEDFCVCPYELSLTYSELCDVIICDFNYLFDPAVYIRRFFSFGGRFAFLIDEAHNLCERAREMYSAEISEGELLCEMLSELSPLRREAEEAAAAFSAALFPLVRDEIRYDKDEIPHGAYHGSNVPGEIYRIFDRLVSVGEDELYSAYAAKDDEKDARIAYLRDYLYRIKKFHSALARFGDGFELLVFLDGDKLRAKLYCLDTGGVIRSRTELGQSAIFFSGTLSPISYYRSVLGGDRTSSVLAVDSPFAKEQLSVTVMNKITTRYSEREDSLLAICRVIAATLSAKRGNYMIFSPSFAYSEALCDAFRKKYPKIRIILQKPHMTDKEKADFLAEFSHGGGGYLAAFCVMGGIYSEGIDLVGDKLIGAVVVGIGMPALSFEREAIAAYYQEKLESGTEYAYLYPGMNRVLQAAGRVIRSENDRGVIVLIDDRFDDPLYKKIVPKLWDGMQFLGDPKLLRERLDEFWQSVSEE